MTNIDNLDNEAIRLLIAGDDPILQILRSQVPHLLSLHREYTGVGYYARYALSNNAPRLPEEASFGFGDVSAEIEGLEFGAGFLLWIRNGLLDCLEVFSYDEPWPVEIGRYRLYYQKGHRDLEALRAMTKWPRVDSLK
jgi:hypothetical protein